MFVNPTSARHDSTRVKTGLEVCLETPPPILIGADFGLLMNQASVDRDFHYSHQLAARTPGKLRAIFSPQHGLWSEQQDNMDETPHGFDAELGVPIYSLYGETRRPTAEMLEGIDVLVVDLQDVGTRVYTFIWTVSLCLEACAQAQIPVLVLDRPNPLGGELVEGPPLDPAQASFVGRASIPMRHGLTIAELTRVVNHLLDIHAEVHVVPMDGWQRWMYFGDTECVWVPPSPNLPRLEGVTVYPGQVLLEGTQLSEGRGTTTPFELCGASYIEPQRLVAELAAFELPGVCFRPIRFVPTFQKHAHASCGGVFLHVVNRATYRPYRTTVAIMACIRRLWPQRWRWLPPPYEYESKKMPIDMLSGNGALREALDANAITPDADLGRLADGEPEKWREQIASELLY